MSLVGKVLQALKLIRQGVYTFSLKMLFNCVTFQSKLLSVLITLFLSIPLRKTLRLSSLSSNQGLKSLLCICSNCIRIALPSSIGVTEGDKTKSAEVDSG
jgi:hypothetical protein